MGGPTSAAIGSAAELPSTVSHPVMEQAVSSHSDTKIVIAHELSEVQDSAPGTVTQGGLQDEVDVVKNLSVSHEPKQCADDMEFQEDSNPAIENPSKVAKTGAGRDRFVKELQNLRRKLEEFKYELQDRHRKLEELDREVKEHGRGANLTREMQEGSRQLPEHEVQWLEDIDCRLDKIAAQLKNQGSSLQEHYDHFRGEYEYRMQEHARWLQEHARQAEEYDKLFDELEMDEARMQHLALILNDFEGSDRRVRDGGEDGESEGASELGDKEEYADDDQGAGREGIAEPVKSGRWALVKGKVDEKM
jgi:hypothetical protein